MIFLLLPAGAGSMSNQAAPSAGHFFLPMTSDCLFSGMIWQAGKGGADQLRSVQNQAFLWALICSPCVSWIITSKSIKVLKIY